MGDSPKARGRRPGLEKARTGIGGLDDLTGGGLPRGRTTLIVGGPGTGKTLMGVEFAVKGAAEYGEPAVIMAFEETAEELAANVKSLGHDLEKLKASKKLAVDHVRVERHEIEETGEYDLEGLFIRLNHAIESVGAKRVVLDTIESLFAGLGNAGVLRAELRRLFGWLKDKGMTSVITAEAGNGHLTREGLEEYVSDCVILLDHRMEDNVPTRRLRVLKYRGSSHGTNEYPFLITDAGISVLPITSLAYSERPTSRERISTGIPRLDAMLGGKGYYRGSTVLVSGTAGTGKTSVAAKFVEAACRRGERAVFLTFEESPGQVARNMRSIGIDLDRWVRKGLLKFYAPRPTVYGLETHLITMQGQVGEFRPRVVVVDPITNFITVGSRRDVRLMLMRFSAFLKNMDITALFTTLTPGGDNLETTAVAISSLADTWILLRDIELGGERNRGIYVLKSRGMAHSNQIREFMISEKGIDLLDVYLGSSGVLTGLARAVREAEDKAQERQRQQEIKRLEADVKRKRLEAEAQIARLRGELERDEAELRQKIDYARNGLRARAEEREAVARSRKANTEVAARPARRARRPERKG
jgi:circadian clock protein KaiC